MFNKNNILISFICTITFLACTNLDVEIQDGKANTIASTKYAVNDANVASLLQGAYVSLREPYQNQARLFVLDEHTTDAIVGPTRGGDWDDNAIYREMHTHTYGPAHNIIRLTFNDLYSSIHTCNTVLGSKAKSTEEQKAEARFLRSLSYYHILDLWGQAAFREIGSNPLDNAKVLSRVETFNFVVSELKEILPNLTPSDPKRANKNAANWLLAKLYLNKAVFTAENSAGPYTFNNEDLDKVISHVDAITGVSLANNYWDNFIPDNTNTSTELIMVNVNEGGVASGNIRSRWHMGQHYNQTPGGWNGFATLADYYDMFDPKDERILKWIPEVTEKSGYNVGFQIGQQYGPGGPANGIKVLDRNKNPLIFTKEVSLIITDPKSIETAGIRGVKYVPDYQNTTNADNDFVIARYADALLMKAEALARKGDNAGAQSIVRMLKNESTTTVSNVDDIYIVRGRELWWEGWRRNDMIRFGKYLESRKLKPSKSSPRAILFPLPSAALLNPNFTQNPGY